MATFPGGIEINPANSAVVPAINNAAAIYTMLERTAIDKRREAWDRDTSVMDSMFRMADNKKLPAEFRSRALGKANSLIQKWYPDMKLPEVSMENVDEFDDVLQAKQGFEKAVVDGTMTSEQALGGFRSYLGKWAARQSELTDAQKYSADQLVKSFSGGEEGKQIKDTTDALRKEFTALPQVKDFQTVASSYQKIKAGVKQNSAAGDLSLIFSYMKLLDPGSVVREGEFATAQNSAGVPDRIRSQYNRIMSGERLTQAQRNDFAQTAKSIYQSQEKYVAGIEDQFRLLAKNRGLNADSVLVNLRAPQEEEAAIPATNVSAPPPGKSRPQSPASPKFKIISVEGK